MIITVADQRQSAMASARSPGGVTRLDTPDGSEVNDAVLGLEEIHRLLSGQP